MANLAAGECSASECSLICNDYTKAGEFSSLFSSCLVALDSKKERRADLVSVGCSCELGYGRIMMVPRVKLAYDNVRFPFAKLKPLRVPSRRADLPSPSFVRLQPPSRKSTPSSTPIDETSPLSEGTDELEDFPTILTRIPRIGLGVRVVSFPLLFLLLLRELS